MTNLMTANQRDGFNSIWEADLQIMNDLDEDGNVYAVGILYDLSAGLIGSIYSPWFKTMNECYQWAFDNPLKLNPYTY